MPDHAEHRQDERGRQGRAALLQARQGITAPTRLLPQGDDKEYEQNLEGEVRLLAEVSKCETGRAEQHVQGCRGTCQRHGQGERNRVPLEPDAPAHNAARPFFQPGLTAGDRDHDQGRHQRPEGPLPYA